MSRSGNEDATTSMNLGAVNHECKPAAAVAVAASVPSSSHAETKPDVGMGKKRKFESHSSTQKSAVGVKGARIKKDAAAAPAKARRQKRQRQSSGAAIMWNNQIVELGKKGDWKGILKLKGQAKREEGYKYNNVNFATAMSQLGRISNVNRRDSRLKKFVGEVSEVLKVRGFEGMGAQGVANIVHAIGKMRLETDPAKRIVEFVARKENVEALLIHGTPQNVSNVCWSLAELGRLDIAPPLFAEVEEHAGELAVKATPQNLANIAWACAKLGLQLPNFFAEIENHSGEVVARGSPQAVANIAWACGTLEVLSPKFFAEIERHAVVLTQRWTPQAVSNTLWAVSRLQYHAPNLLHEIDRRGTSLMMVSEGNVQHLSNAALAFATVGYVADTFFATLAEFICETSGNWSNQNLCNTCYSFVILDLGEKHKDAVVRLWEEAINRDPDKFSNEGLVQVAQTLAFSDAHGIELVRPPERLQEKIRGMRLTEGNLRYEKEVSSLLRELGFAHEVEVSPLPAGRGDLPGSMLSIDLANREHMIAIEYDGTWHYLRSPGTGYFTRHEDGRTQAKRRFLERLGWKVINIHYLDWNKAGDTQEKLSFLRGRLEAVGFKG